MAAGTHGQSPGEVVGGLEAGCGEIMGQWNWAESSLLTQTFASMLSTRESCISYS
jgi:hypothetical protein